MSDPVKVHDSVVNCINREYPTLSGRLPLKLSSATLQTLTQQSEIIERIQGLLMKESKDRVSPAKSSQVVQKPPRDSSSSEADDSDVSPKNSSALIQSHAQDFDTESISSVDSDEMSVPATSREAFRNPLIDSSDDE